MTQTKQDGYPAITKYFGRGASEILLATSTKPEGANVEADMVASGGLTESGVSGRWKFSNDNIMKMVIGSSIFSSDSTFQNSTIFDIPLLNENQKLDINIDSNAKAKSSMGLFSNKEASTDSSMFGLDIGISAKGSLFGAGVEASLGYSQKNATNDSVSSGETYISMIYEIYDSYVDILVTRGHESEDFTAYLVGAKLSDDKLNSYVNYNSDEIKATIYKGCLPDAGNVLGNVQLLGRMEDIFGTIKTEYKKSDDPNRQAELKTQLLNLKSEISKAILMFYSRYGNSFASRLWLAAYAVGGGSLSYENTSGNEQNQYSGKLTLGYSSLASSGSMSVQASYAKEHGYSTAMKSINVTAFAVPANTLDTNAWSSSISNTLTEEGKALAVPPAGTFEMPKFNIPPALVKKKNPLDPPSNCFSSYDDWKQYQADLQADAPKDQLNELNQARGEVKDKGIRGMGFAKASSSCSSSGGEVEDEGIMGGDNWHFEYEDEENEDEENEAVLLAVEYKKTSTEIEYIKSSGHGTAYKLPIQNLRIDNRIVVGFNTTPYNKVLPQLRPDLSIPEESFDFSNFPNLSRLLVINTNLSKLAVYINFMSNFNISCLKDVELATQFDSFVKDFMDKSNDLIASCLKLGIDVDANLAKGMLIEFWGVPDKDFKDCKLFEAMDKSRQKCNYVIYLLKPNVQRIWAEAPGGYLNVMWIKEDTSHTYAVPKYVGSMGSVDRKQDVCECDPLVWDDPDLNPLSLFPQTAQTPLFPIFVHTTTGDPKLYFLQLIKNMQFVLTADNAQFSGPVDYISVPFLNDQLIEPKEIINQNRKITNEEDLKQYFKFDVTQAGFSLSEKDHTWDYGLNFSFLDMEHDRKMDITDNNKVLILRNINSTTFVNGYSCGKRYINPLDGLSNLSTSKKSNKEFSMSDQPCLILKPITSGEYGTEGFDSQAFSMYSNYGPEQIVKCSSLSNAVDLSLIK